MGGAQWIRRRARRPRPVSPSTVGGKTAKELSDEHVEAILNMTPDEPARFADRLMVEADARQAERAEAAARRRAWRHRAN